MHHKMQLNSTKSGTLSYGKYGHYIKMNLWNLVVINYFILLGTEFEILEIDIYYLYSKYENITQIHQHIEPMFNSLHVF